MTIKGKAKEETKFLNTGEKINYRHFYEKGGFWVLDEIEKIINASENINEVKNMIKSLK